MKTWITSDPHFCHTNIIRYENRPFADAYEMTEGLVKNWNQVVSKTDEVFLLGDVAFMGKERTQAVVERLNGHKFLILGNHDRGRSTQWWKDVGFDEVSKYPIIYKGFYILSHEPVYLNENMPYVNVHGHTHGTKMESKQFVNVCVENWGYKPILFSKIEEKFTTKDC